MLRKEGHCPNCGQSIHRCDRHWILTCHRCGWRAGYPGVRWLTHNPLLWWPIDTLSGLLPGRSTLGRPTNEPMDRGRRRLLYALGAAGLGGAGFLAGQNENQVQAAIADVENASKTSGLGNVSQLGIGGGGNQTLQKRFTFSSEFEKIEWTETGTLYVHIPEQHDMDGFGVRHEYHDSPDMDFFARSVDAFGTVVDLPFIQKIANSSVSFPTRRFKLVAYEGFISENIPSNIERQIGTVPFTVPKPIAAKADGHFEG